MHAYVCVCFVTRTKIQFNHGDKSYLKAYHIQIINCFCFRFARVSSPEPINQPTEDIRELGALLFCSVCLYFVVGRRSVGGRVGSN